MRNVMKRTAPLFVLALMALGTARNAQAVGTAADTTITNSASMTYTVGGVAQVPLPIATATLYVDRKINVTVTHMDGGLVTVIPGQTTAVLNFKVQNTGNSKMRFRMSAFNLPASSVTPFAGSSTKTTPALAAYAEHAAGVSMGYDAGSGDTPLTVTLGTNSGVDDFTFAYVVVTIPTTGVVNGDIIAFALKAQAVYTDGTTVITQNLQDVGTHYDAIRSLWNVLADAVGTFAGNAEGDALNDGIGSDRSAFQVTTSELVMSKSVTTFSDPINGTGANKKNIPGAIVEYIITLTNTGTVAAESVSIADALISSTTLQLDPYGSGSCAEKSTNNGGSWAAFTPLTCTGNAVNATLGTIPVNAFGATAVKMRYRAQIN